MKYIKEKGGNKAAIILFLVAFAPFILLILVLLSKDFIDSLSSFFWLNFVIVVCLVFSGIRYIKWVNKL